MHPVGHFHAYRHHPGYFRFSRSSEYCDIVAFVHRRELVCVDGIDQRVAFIHIRNTLALEVWLFKRKNYEESVYPCLELSVAAFSGRPCLRGYIVKGLDSVFVAEFGNLHIESGIVNQYDCIGLVC